MLIKLSQKPMDTFEYCIIEGLLWCKNTNRQIKYLPAIALESAWTTILSTFSVTSFSFVSVLTKVDSKFSQAFFIDMINSKSIQTT